MTNPTGTRKKPQAVIYKRGNGGINVFEDYMERHASKWLGNLVHKLTRHKKA